MEGRALVSEDEVARLQEALHGGPEVLLCERSPGVGASVAQRPRVGSAREGRPEFSEDGGDSGKGMPQTDARVNPRSDLCITRAEVYPAGLPEAVSATTGY